MTDEDFFAQNAQQPKGLSDAEFLGTTPQPVVQSSQTEPSQSRESTRPIVSLPSLTESLFGPTAGQTVQHAQEAAGDIARGIPQMIEKLPEYAYQGLKFAAGGPQEKTQVVERALGEAIPQGRQIASDVQSPIGSREWFRGLGQMGMMAVPALTETIFGHVKPEIPPVQTTPEVPLTEPVVPIATEQAAKEVIPNATQERQITESGVAEHPRDVEGGTPTEAGNLGVVEPSATFGQEKITQSAFKFPSGEIKATGPFHQGEFPAGSEAGFLTTEGRFLDREQAGKLATGLKQPLFAEDFVTNHDIVPSLLEHPIAADAIAAGARSGVPPFTEQPVAPIVPQPEQFPSILQSAEEARRGTQPVSTEGQAPAVAEQSKPEVASAVTESPPIGKDIAKNIPDFPNEEKQIGLTKDYLSEDRKARGEAPLAEQARQTNPETWDNAERIMASNPNAGHELVASIIDNPRTLNPDEVGVLLRHRVNLSNQADIEFNRMTSESSTPMDKGDAVVKMQALNDARNQADQANNIVGTQLGRSFQFLQQLSSQDFSLSGINQQRLAAMGGKELTAPEIEQFTKENAQWSKDLLESDQALQNYQREQSKQSSALKAYKTRLQSATTEYERRLAFSDYAPAIRRELEGDPQLEQLKAARDQVRSQFQDQLVKDQLANRPMWQKVLGGIAWAARESALSGYHTLAKLAGFTGGKLAEIPLTQTAERVWGLIPGFKDIAAQSEFGPGANSKALGKFYSDFFTTGMRQAAQQLRSGTSDFKAQYGDEKIPMNYPSFFGNLHGAEKTPLRVGVAGMTRERIINNTMNDLASKAVSQGQDITDPIVQAAINKKVFDAGTDEILMGNNLFADSVNGLLRKMEANQPKTGEPSATLSVMSTLAKSLITKGIVRTPANFVKQVFERTPAGLGLGVARGIRAIAKGVENVSPGERTAIMRLLGVGSVGSGMYLWGAADALKPPEKRIFGGYYQPGEKRDPNDVKWGSVRVDGVTAPHYLTHNLLSEPAQMGATMMRVALSALSKKDRTNKGLVSGLVASTLGLAEQAPIANPAVRLQKLTDPRQQSNYFGDIVRGLIPQFIQNIAEDTDKSEAGRKPSGVAETVKLAIPGLRQQVPERQVQKPAKSSKFGGAVTQ